ncbi:hypothetical protein [Exiguobacterium sp. AB2]|nr:hypothetical protein [Exiguobacterium sp. AB2]
MNGDRLTRLMGDVDDRFVEESMEVEDKKKDIGVGLAVSSQPPRSHSSP